MHDALKTQKFSFYFSLPFFSQSRNQGPLPGNLNGFRICSAIPSNDHHGFLLQIKQLNTNSITSSAIDDINTNQYHDSFTVSLSFRFDPEKELAFRQTCENLRGPKTGGYTLRSVGRSPARLPVFCFEFVINPSWELVGMTLFHPSCTREVRLRLEIVGRHRRHSRPTKTTKVAAGVESVSQICSRSCAAVGCWRWCVAIAALVSATEPPDVLRFDVTAAPLLASNQ
ncbi:hypothetical protein H6P81_010174 [Aristolochia fimbriata]|uniref:Uncharacterized protein n=1 Tax=Aristolochia fimbriata TaxID=158543 RepID=A0AAV7ENV0_ARIFI|nr:hypothetical protein H6P81_010174 [Aristolochia fimbriata]